MSLEPARSRFFPTTLHFSWVKIACIYGRRQSTRNPTQSNSSQTPYLGTPFIILELNNGRRCESSSFLSSRFPSEFPNALTQQPASVRIYQVGMVCIIHRTYRKHAKGATHRRDGTHQRDRTGVRKKKQEWHDLMAFPHPHRRDGIGCDLPNVYPRLSATATGKF